MGYKKAYGTTVDGDELFLRYRECFQAEGETASDYLTRLHQQLTRVVEADGVNIQQVNNVRVQQFCRGYLYNEELLMKLDLKRRNLAPNFVDLLREVQREEQRVLEKDSRRKTDKKEMPAAKRAAVMAQSTVVREDHRVKHLEEVVAQLQQQLSAALASPPSVTPRPAPRYPTRAPRKRPMVCFNCGQLGHRMEGCTNPRDAERVQQQMIARSQPPRGSGNDSGHQ
ncbi:uncharacterized protein LOC119741168 [Patiria miniata]|uniref:CCHC-type domain-containing protein n=1 Tax=Patiria miniata TaxID=46514 RepID=A0A914B9M5_PATMI|nr:uncharacterized protein LOC119723964 [Patiria miniata]XP_038072806.1 uncharacterized protein LOC119741168 [Patiria miniata]